MKKYLLLILTISAFTFTSCSKDEDENEETKNTLIGIWYKEDAAENECGKTPIQFTDTECKITGNFKINGECNKSVTTYTYTTKDKTLTLKDPNGYTSDFKWTYLISGNKLSITREKGETTTYKKG